MNHHVVGLQLVPHHCDCSFHFCDSGGAPVPRTLSMYSYCGTASLNKTKRLTSECLSTFKHALFLGDGVDPELRVFWAKQQDSSQGTETQS